MSFLSEVESAAADLRPGPPCTAGLMLETLDDELRADVETALATKGIPTSAVVARLRARGIKSPAQHTLNRHARKDCSCG